MDSDTWGAITSPTNIRIELGKILPVGKLSGALIVFADHTGRAAATVAVPVWTGEQWEWSVTGSISYKLKDRRPAWYAGVEATW